MIPAKRAELADGPACSTSHPHERRRAESEAARRSLLEKVFIHAAQDCIAHPRRLSREACQLPCGRIDRGFLVAQVSWHAWQQSSASVANHVAVNELALAPSCIGPLQPRPANYFPVPMSDDIDCIECIILLELVAFRDLERPLLPVYEDFLSLMEELGHQLPLRHHRWKFENGHLQTVRLHAGPHQ